jgi:hypothetical protein
VDSGTKNHIIHLAKWCIYKSWANEILFDILQLINQANAKPKEIINRGAIFIMVGRINVFIVRKVNHLIALPAIIDIVPNIIVGRIIFISSLIERKELVKLGPHRTINLNRAE